MKTGEKFQFDVSVPLPLKMRFVLSILLNETMGREKPNACLSSIILVPCSYLPISINRTSVVEF